MAVTPSRPVVGVAASRIAQNAKAGRPESQDEGNVRALLKNVTATGAIYLGGDNTVAAGNGFKWDVADGPLTIVIEPGEELWAIRDTVDQTLHVLTEGR